VKRNPQADISEETGHPGRLRSLAASARLANVPSVASNVCVGAVIALMSGADESSVARHLAFVVPAGICLYLAGNFLNDWSDKEWDARHRPERALPRGLFKPGLYLTTAAVFSLLGMGLAAAANIKSLAAATAIMAFVLIYTIMHKRSAWSVIPMGLCRALLPTLGFFGCAGNAAAFPAWSLAPGMALFCYITGLSLSARQDSRLSWSPIVLLALAGTIAACGALGFSADVKGLIIAVGWFVIWMLLCNGRFRKPVSTHVSSLLAGIPLVDWIFILPVVMAMEESRAITTVHGLIWVAPLAFLAGLALQRLAPAT
jgi:4-hydroxybenzoate polyprenyltransferase